MNKPIKIVLALLAMLALFGAYQYYAYFASSKKPEVSALKDAVTGTPLSLEEVAKIENQQKIDKRIFSISGPVESNRRGVLVISRKEGANVYMKLSSDGTIVKKVNGEDIAIKMEDIQIGDMVSVVFPGGITEADIASNKELVVRAISVYSSSAESQI
ncbi:MAG: hypothetical protein WC878_00135 [Candidatus Paceibacterota bacterium]|jgi:hypothetical protein